jgi:hypothetical protein
MGSAISGSTPSARRRGGRRPRAASAAEAPRATPTGRRGADGSRHRGHGNAGHNLFQRSGPGEEHPDGERPAEQGGAAPDHGLLPSPPAAGRRAAELGTQHVAAPARSGMSWPRAVLHRSVGYDGGMELEWQAELGDRFHAALAARPRPSTGSKTGPSLDCGRARQGGVHRGGRRRIRGAGVPPPTGPDGPDPELARGLSGLRRPVVPWITAKRNSVRSTPSAERQRNASSIPGELHGFTRTTRVAGGSPRRRGEQRRQTQPGSHARLVPTATRLSVPGDGRCQAIQPFPESHSRKGT